MAKLRSKIKFLILSISAFIIPLMSAQASNQAWKHPLVNKPIQDICDWTETVQMPTQDYPSAEDKLSLKNCSSRNLYYGIFVAKDYVAARKCAFMEMEAYSEGYADGAAILMMIYANGHGVTKNLNVAKKMACEMSYEPQELETRIKSLSAKDFSTIDICEHVISAKMAWVCIATIADLNDEYDLSQLQKTTAEWSPEHKKFLEQLITSAREYFILHSANEIDSSNYKNQEYYDKERGFLISEFIKSISSFEKNKKLSYSNNDFIKAESDLGTAYQNAVNTNFGETSTISKEKIVATQLSWDRYRDSWVQFAAARYPNISSDAIKTWLTLERIKTLKNITAGTSKK